MPVCCGAGAWVPCVGGCKIAVRAVEHAVQKLSMDPGVPHFHSSICSQAPSQLVCATTHECPLVQPCPSSPYCPPHSHPPSYLGSSRVCCYTVALLLCCQLVLRWLCFPFAFLLLLVHSALDLHRPPLWLWLGAALCCCALTPLALGLVLATTTRLASCSCLPTLFCPGHGLIASCSTNWQK